ncbi:hypothetical protein V6R21_10935 [Limibacter armeniacum]|uniref:hypothetical protein n=1 Tax=Limibacter armeniacum TaxID=466084 RepID=UPI002FE6587D
MKRIFTLLWLCTIALTAYAQQPQISNFRPYSQNGVNIFEPPKEDDDLPDKVRVRIGGNFALQYQSLDHENKPFEQDGVVVNELLELGDNFNNATANLNLDVALLPGVRMNLVTYLSSRHHNEAWVKGGYLQVDAMEFLNSSLIDDIMDVITIKVGHMEINYGDAHFRRTDNANAMYNPFVGNLIMDGFTTEIGGEVYYRQSGFLAMVAVTSGSLRGSALKQSEENITFYGKLGFDTDPANDDDDDEIRLRITGSIYNNSSLNRNTLYGGDRSGARYYHVLANDASDFTTGRFNPGFNEVTSYMINPFIEFVGLEFFGTYEHTSGKKADGDKDGSYDQLAGELIYRFGGTEQFYVGGRYNTVWGNDVNDAPETRINRVQADIGWFISKNILMKVEYVKQEYKDFPEESLYSEGEFDGLMIEAAIGF